MAERQRRKRRANHAQPVPRAGFLMNTGKSIEDLAQQEKDLRAALSWENLSPDEAQPSEPLMLDNPEPASLDEPDLWGNLPMVPLNIDHMRRMLVITAARKDPAHAAFDVLRARLMQALTDNGWKSVGITSPTRDCGKTFVSANLAISLSRYENCRTLLMDLDMRNPSVAKTLGLKDNGEIGQMLRGEKSLQDHIRVFEDNNLNIGDNLAFALNDKVEPYASELLQSADTKETLAEIDAQLAPDVVLYDLPPALANDDVLSFEQNIDGLLIVVDGTRTSGEQVREIMRRLGDDKPLLGVVLNKAEEAKAEDYGY